MFYNTKTKAISLLLLLVISIIYTNFTGFYGQELVIEAAILAILALSLDMVAGYGGMVSLCHGAIFGLGAYTFGTLTTLFGWQTEVSILVGILTCAVFGFAVGAVTSKTAGIFFIMATLAFGQMVYVLIFDARALGGDDGMSGLPRLDLSWLGINMQDGLTFALFTIVITLIVYLILSRVMSSGFGRTLVGIRSNESRMRAVGLDVWKYKSGAFAISGAIAGLAGTLAGQHTMFISPQMLAWTGSGEALVVVILGGLGTLIGPIWGAILFVFLKHEVSALTSYWHLVVGLVLIATVLMGNRGIYGQIEHMIENRKTLKNSDKKEVNSHA
ncbi:branched-chain amino acid ABC transporter permease [Sneathiella sp. P13V-1]|uniref:branched-chain amino acid ABC transporter permease n=1 Tax=Sneathiella sp. P13V-1 TaxID=2697366 RepID=UPI00187BB6D6|nr:branched-chain amino acid ABC transporter permease [Sneathiella sp. P13V-1]MBE7637470.1 branched-chain amino acid ABC transporter permease [Sneathiella sp. P13V-1]